MNRHNRANDLLGTDLYKGGSAFKLGEAAQVMKLVSNETLPILEKMVEEGDLLAIGEYWKKPAAGMPFHWRTDYNFMGEGLDSPVWC